MHVSSETGGTLTHWRVLDREPPEAKVPHPETMVSCQPTYSYFCIISISDRSPMRSAGTHVSAGQAGGIDLVLDTSQTSADFEQRNIILQGILVVVRMVDDLTDGQSLLVGVLSAQRMSSTGDFLTVGRT